MALISRIDAILSGRRARAARHGWLAALFLLARMGGGSAAQTAPPPPTDQAVAFQINVAHTGSVTTPGLTPPLARKWQADLGADVSYPLIAGGKVFVTAGDNQGHTPNLYALDAATGQIVWGPVSLKGTYYWAAACFDAGRVFAVNDAGQMWAFDAQSGAALWTEALPGQYSFSSPPTARDGTVYVGGAGSGGTLYAVREADGAILWTQGVLNGGNSSPALGDDGVYVSYAGPQSYKFDLTAGLPLWHYSSSTEGGGGATPVLGNGRLYVRDVFSSLSGSPNGLILDAALGTQVGTFSADTAPAFDNGGLFLVQGGSLQAQDALTSAARWFSDMPGDPYVTAPIVANGIVYAGTAGGELDAYNESSPYKTWSDHLGTAILGPNEFDFTRPTTGLAAGQGMLVVPAGTRLVAYVAAGSPGLPNLSGLSPSFVTARGGDLTLTATGSNFAPSAQVMWNGTPLATTVVSATQLSALVPAALTAAAGTARVAVAHDGTTTGSLIFTVNNPAPTLTAVSPDSVPTGGPDFTLTVSGANFVPGAVINWNGAPTQTTVVSATTLTAVVPAALIAAGGSIPVTVTNPAPGGGTSAPRAFAVVSPVPTLTGLSPNSAPADGHSVTLTLTGAGFVSNSLLSLGNGSNVMASAVTPTQMTVTVPGYLLPAPSTLSLSVVNPAPGGGASSALPFTLTTPTPAISGLYPTQATAGGGPLSLVINGSGFVPGSVPQWNGTALQVIGYGATQITATVPSALTAAAGTAQITVSNGAAGTSNAVALPIVNGIPTLSALSPASVAADGPDVTITLTGTNFVPTTVAWTQEGGTSDYPYGRALATTYVSPTQLTAVVPAALLAGGGTLHLQARNPAPGGGFSVALPLGVVSPTPTLTALSPAQAAPGGPAFTLTVTGTGFVGTPPTFYGPHGSVVQWNGSPLTTAYVSPTQLSATVPAADIATAGTAQVTVTNTAPGGGTTASLTFTIADTSAPTTTASLSGTSGTNGWYRTPVQVTLSATDPDGAGDVAATHYTLDGGAAQTYTAPFLVGGDGTHTLTFWSVDKAGNAEVSQALTVKIDGTPPVVAFGTPAPAPNAAGWNHTPVDIPYSATDATSGLASSTPGSPIHLAAEGRAQTVSVTATDSAGNAATVSTPAISIDLTPPVTTGSVSGAQVTLSAMDALSGVAATFYTLDGGAAQTYRAPFTVGGVGAHTVKFWSRDRADNGEALHSLPLTVNPAPSLSSLSPSSARAGGTGFPLSISGAGFVPGSTAWWNGAALVTTYVSATRLSAAVPATGLAAPGTVQVSVISPGPGGGTSGALTFAVTPAGYVSVTPSVASNTNLWWGQENVGISSAKTITALSVTIKVKQTGGLSFHDQFYTGPWGPLAQSRASSASALTYTWTMKAGQSIAPGAWYCAAQWNGQGLPHPTSGDSYAVSATAGGQTQTFSGHF